MMWKFGSKKVSWNGGIWKNCFKFKKKSQIWTILNKAKGATYPVQTTVVTLDGSWREGRQLTSRAVHASLAVPLLKYFHFSFNQRATTRSLVRLNLGSLFRYAARAHGNSTFSSFSMCSFAVVWGWGSTTGLRKWSGIFTRISGQAIAFNTTSNVNGSEIFANEDIFAAYDDMWVCTSERWLKAIVINSLISIFHFFSGSWWINSHATGVL